MSIVENEDVVGAPPTGDATTTYELSTVLLPTKVQLILGLMVPIHSRTSELGMPLVFSEMFPGTDCTIVINSILTKRPEQL